MEFKEDFLHLFIRAQKNPTKTWHQLPYLVTDDVIFAVHESSPLESCTLAGSTVEAKKSAVEQNKEEMKLQMVQIVEKCMKEEVLDKDKAVHDSLKLVEEQQKTIEEEH